MDVQDDRGVLWRVKTRRSIPVNSVMDMPLHHGISICISGKKNLFREMVKLKTFISFILCLVEKKEDRKDVTSKTLVHVIFKYDITRRTCHKHHVTL